MRYFLLGVAGLMMATTAMASGLDPRSLSPIRPLLIDSPLSRSAVTVASGADCAGGIAYDDGTDPIGFSYIGSKPAPDTYTAAMRFQLPGAANKINAVCVRMAQFLIFSGDSQIPLDIDVWAADGPNGAPGALLGSLHNVLAVPVPHAFCDDNTPFYRFEIPGGITVPTDTVYIGATWGVGGVYDNGLGTTELCGYLDGTGSQPAYVGGSRPPSKKLGEVGSYPTYKSLSIRAEAEVVDITPPPPPTTGAITTTAYPGYTFWVRIGDTRIGTQTSVCVPETVCVAGAISTRAEVFLRIVGPKSNGYLWPNVVKFNTAKTEVWIKQTSTGRIRYYNLPALATDSSTLPGLVDKTGFLP